MIGLDGQNRTASKSFGDSCVAITLHRDGTPGRNRTCDPRLRRPLFYPLNYGRKTGAGREIRTPLLRFGRPPCNRKHFTRKTGLSREDRTPDLLLPKQAHYLAVLYSENLVPPHRIELRTSDYKTDIIPFNYRGVLIIYLVEHRVRFELTNQRFCGPRH
jgi:hypothetical protein